MSNSDRAKNPSDFESLLVEIASGNVRTAKLFHAPAPLLPTGMSDLIAPEITISDDEMKCMPWTRNLTKPDALQRWAASRKDAGLVIDIETCELGHWAQGFDVYGVKDLPPEMRQIGTNRYVRSADSNGWINEEDLPAEKVRAMYDRIGREFKAYCREHPDEPRVQGYLRLTVLSDRWDEDGVF